MESAEAAAITNPFTRARPALGQQVWAALLLGSSVIGGFVWILHSQLQRLYGLTAPGWDLGQTQQVLWSLATAHGWTSSYEYGKDFLGIHLEPILLPIAGVEMLWPHPAVPLIFSALGLAATGPAGYLMLRSLLGNQPRAAWLSLGLAVPMPFWAATQQAAGDQFHPENMALALAMLATWAGLSGRRWLFWALVVAVLSCKEDQTYTTFVVGLVVWRFGAAPIWRQGRLAMGVAALWLVLAVALLRLLANGAETPGLAYYWWIWQGGPNFFFIAISQPDPWLVLAGLMGSLLALPLLAPRWLLLAIPVVGASLLSSHDPMHRLHLHYVLLVMFPLIVSAGVGARRLLTMDAIPAWLPAPALLAASVPALAIAFVAGQLPPALGAQSWLYDRPAADGRLLAATAVIPAGAPVNADDGAVVWLSGRPRVSILHDHAPPDLYVVIDRDAWAHRGDPPSARTAVFGSMQASGRHLLRDDGRFQVWGPVGS